MKVVFHRQSETRRGTDTRGLKSRRPFYQCISILIKLMLFSLKIAILFIYCQLLSYRELALWLWIVKIQCCLFYIRWRIAWWSTMQDYEWATLLMEFEWSLTTHSPMRSPSHTSFSSWKMARRTWHAFCVITLLFTILSLVGDVLSNTAAPWYENLPAVTMDYKVHIDAGKEDCYYQYVQPGATFYASYQVLGLIAH